MCRPQPTIRDSVGICVDMFLARRVELLCQTMKGLLVLSRSPSLEAYLCFQPRIFVPSGGLIYMGAGASFHPNSQRSRSLNLLENPVKLSSKKEQRTIIHLLPSKSVGWFGFFFCNLKNEFPFLVLKTE